MEFFKWEQHFNTLSSFSPLLLRYLTTAILDFLTKRSPALDFNQLHARLETESGSLLPKSLTTKACQGLQFLLHWLLTHNPQNTGKFTLDTILGSHSALSDAHLSAIAQAYSDYHVARSALHKGEILQDSQWTVGVAVQTDLQPDLLQPYVRGSFRLIDSTTGQEKRRVVEFSIPQFQEFVREMKRASSVLSSY